MNGLYDEPVIYIIDIRNMLINTANSTVSTAICFAVISPFWFTNILSFSFCDIVFITGTEHIIAMLKNTIFSMYIILYILLYDVYNILYINII